MTAETFRKKRLLNSLLRDVDAEDLQSTKLHVSFLRSEERNHLESVLLIQFSIRILSHSWFRHR